MQPKTPPPITTRPDCLDFRRAVRRYFLNVYGPGQTCNYAEAYWKALVAWHVATTAAPDPESDETATGQILGAEMDARRLAELLDPAVKSDLHNWLQSTTTQPKTQITTI